FWRSVRAPSGAPYSTRRGLEVLLACASTKMPRLRRWEFARGSFTISILPISQLPGLAAQRDLYPEIITVRIVYRAGDIVKPRTEIARGPFGGNSQQLDRHSIHVKLSDLLADFQSPKIILRVPFIDPIQIGINET